MRIPYFIRHDLELSYTISILGKAARQSQFDGRLPDLRLGGFVYVRPGSIPELKVRVALRNLSSLCLGLQLPLMSV